MSHCQSEIRYGAVFDFDGTLVKSNEIKHEAFKSFAEKLVPQSERIMAKVLANSRGDRYSIWRKFLSEIDWQLENRDFNLLLNEFSAELNCMVVNSAEVDGAAECLLRLRQQKVYIAVNSATPLQDLKLVFEKRRWSPLIDDLFGAPSSKIDNMKKIFIKTGFDCEHVAVFGDGEDDLLSATRAGCRFYPVGEARGVENGQQTYTLKGACDHFVASIQ